MQFVWERRGFQQLEFQLRSDAAERIINFTHFTLVSIFDWIFNHSTLTVPSAAVFTDKPEYLDWTASCYWFQKIKNLYKNITLISDLTGN